MKWPHVIPFWKENYSRLIILFWFCLVVSSSFQVEFSSFISLIVGNHRSLVIIIIISAETFEKKICLSNEAFSRVISSISATLVFFSVSQLSWSTIYSADYCQDSVGVIFGSSNFSQFLSITFQFLTCQFLLNAL